MNTKTTLQTVMLLAFFIHHISFNIAHAQNFPYGINYQAVARDANGNAQVNQPVTLRFTIFKTDTLNANQVWQEVTSTIQTNSMGQFNWVIGSAQNASFSAIDWASDIHFLRVERNVGGNYQWMGKTSQFQSVPYALATPIKDYAVFEQQESNNVNGGNAVAGWQTRNLNTQVVNVGNAIAPLANQTITLQPGTYYIKGGASAWRIAQHKVCLRKVVAGVPQISDYVLVGTSEFASDSDFSTSWSTIDGYLTVTTQTSYVLYHYTEGSTIGGLGRPTATGLHEVYARVVIQKIN
jgi:hypothetical protein